MVVHIHRTAFEPHPAQNPAPAKKKVKKKGPPPAIIFRDRSSERKPKDTAPQDPVAKKTESTKPAAGDALSVIREAMQGQRALSFVYSDHTGCVTSRTVEPYKVTVSKVGDLVLYGYCLEKDGIRTFKLAAMQDCTLEKYTFDPRYPIEDMLD